MANDEKRRDPAAMLATLIMEKTWDWDEVQAVYIPKKMHRELQRLTERIAKEMPDVRNGPSDPSNLQHFVAMAVAYQMGMATLHLLSRKPMIRLIAVFGEVLGEILGDLFDDDEKAGEGKAKDGSEAKDGEHRETSPLN